MKQLIFGLILLASMMFACSAAWGDSEKAEFSIYLFQQGFPIADAELTISSVNGETDAQLGTDSSSVLTWLGEGEAALKTNANGSIAAKLPPGKYHMTLRTPNQAFAFDLPLRAAENVQILVTFYPDGREPLMNIESSATGTFAGVEPSTEQLPAEGDGVMRVKVVSVENDKPIKNVQVFVSGLRRQLRTDEEGMLKANIPVGEYSVSLLHPAYSSQTQEEVKIRKDQTTELSFNLTPAGVELEEYVVLEPYLAGTLASVIEEQKSSTEVTTVLGAEQFSRSGDSDVASALRRASGLTLVGGQFIFIRGLGERYSSTLVNGASVPSPDPTRRVVPLDLFPTNFLESVLVQKSYSADRPGEFAGGTLEMRTRGIPDEFFFNFSASTGINDNATFSDGLTYDGGGTDFLSFDDGTRALPDSLEAALADGGQLQLQSIFNPDGFTPEEIETFGEDLSDVWDVTTETPGPDRGFDVATGNVFNLGNFRAGYIAGGSWSQQFRKQNEINREFSPIQNSDQLTMIQDFDTRRSLKEMQLNGYVAAEVEYKDSHRLYTKTLFLRQAVDEARISEGFTDEETFNIRRTRLRFFSNQLRMHQVGGDHQFDWAKDLSVSWLYTNATARREEPNTRDYRFDEIAEGAYSFSRRPDSNQILFNELTDKDESWRVDTKLPIGMMANLEMDLNGGFILQNKVRDSSIRRFRYRTQGPDSLDPAVLSLSSLESILQPDFIGPNGFVLQDNTLPTDSYNASQKLFSYYGRLDMSLYNRFNITGGVRWEDNDQFVETFRSVGNSNQTETSEINRVDMLPAVTATWFISEKQQLRAGFSQTISRPDFRELSAAPFIDLNTNQITTGNPDLQQTDVTNFDIRWEYYLSPGENLMASFFWKDLTNPIELVTVQGTAGLQTFSNANEAKVYGFELELLKGIGFLHPKLENFYLGGNYTWSDSNVQLRGETLQSQTTNNRPLQGHSSQIVNLQLGYENPGWGTQATVLYNVASRRISAAGVQGLPDKYEQPYHQLDFVFNQTVNKWLSVRLNLQNLLDDDVLIEQGGELTRQFRRGRRYSLGVRITY